MKSILTLTAFKLSWLAIVFGALWSQAWLGLTAVAVFALFEIGVRGRQDIVRGVLLVALAGYAVDNAYVVTELLRFEAPSLLPAPIWMALLWVNFALIVEDGLHWLQDRPLLAAVIGGISGPLAYLAGVKLGLIVLLAPNALVVGVIAMTWAAALPLLVYALGTRVRRARDRQLAL